MKETIIKLTSDRIKIKGAEYVQDSVSIIQKPKDACWKIIRQGKPMTSAHTEKGESRE